MATAADTSLSANLHRQALLCPVCHNRCPVHNPGRSILGGQRSGKLHFTGTPLMWVPARIFPRGWAYTCTFTVKQTIFTVAVAHYCITQAVVVIFAQAQRFITHNYCSRLYAQNISLIYSMYM